MTSGFYHVAVPFIVGWPAEFAVHSSIPARGVVGVDQNSLPSNKGCTPR